MRNDYPLPNISKIDSGYVAELARLVSIVNKKNASSHPNFLEKGGRKSSLLFYMA